MRETTPLLQNTEDAESSHAHLVESPTIKHSSILENFKVKASQYTRVFNIQLVLLLLTRFGEGATFAVAFPFVNFMIYENGLVDTPEQAGYIAGIIEGVFPFAEFLVIPRWSALSKRIGRKPVTLIALCAVSVAAPLFGLSHSLWAMLATRALAGSLNGNIAVIKSAMNEITPEEDLPVAFSFDPLAWGLGSSVGLFIGGYFDNPVERWPSTFGGINFFIKNPHFLPCLVAALIPALIAISCFIFLKETRVNNGEEDEEEEDEQQSILTSSNNGSSTSLASFSSTLSVRTDRISIILSLACGLSAFVSMAHLVLTPLMAFTPIESGGLGLTTRQLGTTLSVSRFVGLVSIQAVAYPIIQKYIEPFKLICIQAAVWPIMYACFPVLNIIAMNFPDTYTIISVSVFVVVERVAGAALVTALMCLKNLISSPNKFDKANARLQATVCLVRSFAPPLSAILYAFSIEHQVLGGYAVWLALELLGLAMFGLCTLIYDSQRRRALDMLNFEVPSSSSL